MEGRSYLGEYWPWILSALLGVALAVAAVHKLTEKPDEAGAIADVLNRVYLTDTPENCELYTQRLLSHYPHDRDADLFAGCRAAVDGEAQATSLRISRVRVKGGTAKALATMPAEGLAVTVGLVNTGGWKLDRVVDVEINMPAYGRHLFAGDRKNDGLSRAEARCATRRVLGLGKTWLEDAYLSGDLRHARRLELTCYSPRSLRRELSREIQSGVAGNGAPPEFASCVAEQVTLALNARQLRAYFFLSAAGAGKAARQAALKCRQASSVSGPHYAPAPSRAGPMTPAWRAFADQVDRTCAVNFNQGLLAQDQLYAVADRAGWSELRTEAVVHYSWARWQRSTFRMTGRLGTPPERAELFARWRANVGERAELFRREGDAWLAGKPSLAGRLTTRQDHLKVNADVMGQRFGLRVCTSNGPGKTPVQ